MQCGTLFFALKVDCFCFKHLEEQRNKMKNYTIIKKKKKLFFVS